MAVKHRHFNSSYEYAEFAKQALDSPAPRYWYSSDRDGWRAYQGIELVKNGDESNVSQALDLLANFTERIETPHLVWEHSLAGAFPDVPRYLNGDPDGMWCRDTTPSDRGPVRVWFGLHSSAWISEDQLRARGIALAAFAIAMSEVRPVYITCYNNRQSPENSASHSILSWDIQTSPLVLSELLACTSNPEVTRMLSIPLLCIINREVNYPGCSFPMTRELLGCGEDDIFLPPIIGSDELVTNPVAWIKRNLEKYSHD